MYVFQCCLADRDGEYYAFWELRALDIADAIAQARHVVDMFPGCRGMSIFCGNVRVFTNVECTKPKRRLARLRK